MIIGKVTANREAVVRLTVRGPGGAEGQVEAIVDTGYNGFLTLPLKLIVDLALIWRRRDRAFLADGSETFFDLYEATILWDGEPRRIAVDAVDVDSLLGMSLLIGHELKVEVTDGGTVAIEALA